MTHASLFSGIGGFDLAAEWMEWENVFHCELDKKLFDELKRKWPNAIGFRDISKTDFNVFRGLIDILTGGFPCQTFSLAGKGAMDLTLWKEMLRAIREIKPTWVVAENVYGIVIRKQGMAVERVCSDMEAEGYTVLPPIVLPAASLGANHLRNRTWIVAHNNKNRLKTRLQPQSDKRSQEKKRLFGDPYQLLERSAPRRLRSLDDGLSNWVAQIAGYGNAIMPQLAFQIFDSIDLYEMLYENDN